MLVAGVGLGVVLPFGESLVPRAAPRPVLASLAAVILAVTAIQFRLQRRWVNYV